MKISPFFITVFCLSCILSCDEISSPVLPLATPTPEAIQLAVRPYAAPGGWCGDAALVMIGCYYTGCVPSDQLLRDQETWVHAYRHTKLLRLTEICPIANHVWGLGCLYESMDINRVWDELLDGNPVIVLLIGYQRRYYHVIVVYGMDSTTVWYHDPTLGGHRTVSRERLHSVMAEVGYGYVFRP